MYNSLIHLLNKCFPDIDQHKFLNKGIQSTLYENKNGLESGCGSNCSLNEAINKKDRRLHLGDTHKPNQCKFYLICFLISMVDECIIIDGNDYATSNSVENIVEMLTVHLELLPFHFELLPFLHRRLSF